MSILYIVIGVALLVYGGDFLVKAAVSISLKFNISKVLIGLTVVSFATSLPELVVSVQAALKGFSDISLGNVIGSNIANIGLVLGLVALIKPVPIDPDFYKFNWPVMMLFSVLLFVFLHTNHVLSFGEGLFLFCLLIIFIVILIKRQRQQQQLGIAIEDADFEEITTTPNVSNLKIFFWLIVGGIGLWGGSELLVLGAVDLATTLGVSERVIAVTIIAVGTSIPELAASLIAIVKNEKAISFANIIGSNIFNIGSVLGITALIQPIAVQSQQVLSNDLYWMLGFSLTLLPMAFIAKKHMLTRIKAFFIFAAYLLFVFLAYV